MELLSKEVMPKVNASMDKRFRQAAE